MQTKTYVFFGIVGAGKGTQIEFLKNILGKDNAKKIVFVAPGIEYRALTASGSYTGQNVKTTIEKGQLQPDFLTISICTSIMIKEMTEDCHLIVDAYPRTLGQSDAFMNAMGFYKRENIEIVYIEISKDEAIKRMKLRGRADDTDEGINRRFWEYENNVVPAMNDLEKNGCRLYKINGEQAIEAVHEEIKKVLAL